MPRWLIPTGRIFYASGLIGIGIQHFIFSDFIAVIVPAWPSWIPGRSLWAYAVGAALIVAGVTIILDRKARIASVVLGATLLILVVFGHIPVQLAASPAHLGVWTNAFKALSLSGGAWVVAASLEERKSLMPYGRFFLPVTMIVFGIAHFVYPDFVATLVPAWIPGKVFWTYFTGTALIAAGAAMILNIQARLASLMLGIMIFLWFLFLHIPRAFADPHSGKGNEWTSVCEALAFSGIAFMLAVLPASNPLSISSSD